MIAFIFALCLSLLDAIPVFVDFNSYLNNISERGIASLPFMHK
jgi:hypothetical protein